MKAIIDALNVYDVKERRGFIKLNLVSLVYTVGCSFANYDATYGSLGAGIGLMMWLWMSAIVVLFGAELNSQIDLVQMPSPRDRSRVHG